MKRRSPVILTNPPLKERVIQHFVEHPDKDQTVYTVYACIKEKQPDTEPEVTEGSIRSCLSTLFKEGFLTGYKEQGMNIYKHSLPAPREVKMEPIHGIKNAQLRITYDPPISKRITSFLIENKGYWFAIDEIGTPLVKRQHPSEVPLKSSSVALWLSKLTQKGVLNRRGSGKNMEWSANPEFGEEKLLQKAQEATNEAIEACASSEMGTVWKAWNIFSEKMLATMSEYESRITALSLEECI